MLAVYSKIIVLCGLLHNTCGDNRELIPQDAPSNLTLLEIRSRQVLIEWDPVDPESLRGKFKGYLVRTWNDAGSQVYAFPPEVTRANVEFFPFSKNFITVSARNEKYVGPPSEAISFDAPQIAPNHPFTVNVFTLSSASVFIQWSKPTEPNGILLGYKIYTKEINESVPYAKMKEVVHLVNDSDKLQAKLTGLDEGMTYRIGISAVNCAGESNVAEAEVTMESHTSAPPFVPRFIYKINYTTPNRDEVCYKSTTTPIPVEDEKDKEEEFDYYDYLIASDKKPKTTEASKTTTVPQTEYNKRCIVNCMVLWVPDVKNNPGEHFYVKYKIKGEKEYRVTDPEMSEDYIILQNFDACKNYEIILTAVDGEHSTESGILLTPTKVF
ncbi:hypothetical protein Zmor_025144 [Zophobas morio]|uniref:Fibronectin type-III domain-containing protein n=1 Tax=Zophobas morio TaxID=2755281 RepID=A0AA38HRF3_9CUCU|nr:hypothetical protein Zmor_025144 [Zophobas morio]